MPPAKSDNLQLAFEHPGYSGLHDTPSDEVVVAEVWRMLRKRKLLIAGMGPRLRASRRALRGE